MSENVCKMIVSVVLCIVSAFATWVTGSEYCCLAMMLIWFLWW